MIRLLSISFALAAVTLSAANTWAAGTPVVQPNAAKQFAALPDGVRFPEGIAVNPATGEVFVGTFDFGPNTNALLRFSRTGRLLAMLDFGTAPLLGLAYNALDDKVYIANFGSNNFPAPNALTFDSTGALYVSDSFQGAIYRIDAAHLCSPCAEVTVVHDPLLATAGFPPFGANGIDLNADESALFIANSGDDRILRLDLGTNTVSVFAESINGADGIAFDEQGRLWVAANQADQVTVLNRDGRVIAELGEFLGVRPNGSVRGLSFPASLAIVGNKVLVTNLALPLTGSADPEADITRYSLSRINVPRF